MKIISGKYKGRTLDGFTLEGTRPTMDRVKESLFAIIQEHITNSIVLDLFSGSGNLGIEALSEGASYAYLVDANYKATATIRKNINRLGITQAAILTMDYKKALDELKRKSQKFSIIFLDPPYKTTYIEESLKRIIQNDLLEEDGIIVCESDDLKKVIYPKELTSVKQKKYGDKFVVFLKKI